MVPECICRAHGVQACLRLRRAAEIMDEIQPCANLKDWEEDKAQWVFLDAIEQEYVQVQQDAKRWRFLQWLNTQQQRFDLDAWGPRWITPAWVDTKMAEYPAWEKLAVQHKGRGTRPASDRPQGD